MAIPAGKNVQKIARRVEIIWFHDIFSGWVLQIRFFMKLIRDEMAYSTGLLNGRRTSGFSCHFYSESAISIELHNKCDDLGGFTERDDSIRHKSPVSVTDNYTIDIRIHNIRRIPNINIDIDKRIRG